MIPEYNRKSLALGIPGLILQYGPFLAIAVLAHGKNQSGPPLPEIAAYAVLGGVILGSAMLILGLCYYAKAKGYSAVIGLLGLLSCVGLLILAVLPDRTKN